MKNCVPSIIIAVMALSTSTIAQVATLTNNVPIGIDMKPTSLGLKVGFVDDPRSQKTYRFEAKFRLLPYLNSMSIPVHQGIELNLLDQEGKLVQVIFPKYFFGAAIEKKSDRFQIPRDKNCFVSIDHVFSVRDIKSGNYTLVLSRVKMRINGGDKDFVPPPHRKAEFASKPFAVP